MHGDDIGIGINMIMMLVTGDMILWVPRSGFASRKGLCVWFLSGSNTLSSRHTERFSQSCMNAEDFFASLAYLCHCAVVLVLRERCRKCWDCL